MLLENAIKQLQQELDACGVSKEDRATMWLNAAILVARSVLTVSAGCAIRQYIIAGDPL